MRYHRRLIPLAILFIGIGLAIGLAISSNPNYFTRGYTKEVEISKESIDVLTKINIAMSEISTAVKPAVVGVVSWSKSLWRA